MITYIERVLEFIVDSLTEVGQYTMTFTAHVQGEEEQLPTVAPYVLKFHIQRIFGSAFSYYLPLFFIFWILFFSVYLRILVFL